MKLKILTLFLLLIGSTVCSQIVNIPDANFKNACVNFLVVDTDGDGSPDADVDTNDDGEIQVSEAEAVEFFFPRNSNIVSLQGIEAFVNLRTLNCAQNQLASLDVTQNVLLENLACFFNDIPELDISTLTNLKTLDCDFNELTELDVSSNINLERLNFPFNQLSNIDLSQNINLINLDAEQNDFTAIDISQNPNLEVLSVESNQITSMDFSQNPLLRVVDLHDNLIVDIDMSANTTLDKLWCYDNDLASLNIKNGNNMAISLLNATNNPNLTCIQVDDPVFAAGQGGWNIDATALYSEDCVLGVNESEKFELAIAPNPVANRLQIETNGALRSIAVQIHDVLGRQVYVNKGVYEYVDISHLKSGLFFLTLTSESGKLTKQFIKE
ncbi:MAG: hypothetical protein Aureis2KO_03440 [Aureisphaera sp.]